MSTKIYRTYSIAGEIFKSEIHSAPDGRACYACKQDVSIFTGSCPKHPRFPLCIRCCSKIFFGRDYFLRRTARR